MPVIDISRSLTATIAVWPGDTPFQLARNLERRQGASVNLSTLTLSAHTGSHVDAPYHFSDEGNTVEALDLDLFWGPAQVVTVEKENGPLLPDDFRHYNLNQAARLLVRSHASNLDPTLFPEEFPYPAPELASFLSDLGIRLYGSDGPSMDAADSRSLPGHNALAKHGIAILEGLDLSKAPDGLYQFVALPLKIAGADGSPVRAALRPLSR